MVAGLAGLLAGLACPSFAQTLNVPRRPANALGGQDFVNVISPDGRAARMPSA